MARETAAPEAEVYGAGSFYHLLRDDGVQLRVCSGTPCRLRGADALLAAARRSGLAAEPCSCLAACDTAPAVLVDRVVQQGIGTAEIEVAARAGELAAQPDREVLRGAIGPEDAPDDSLAIHLHREAEFDGAALQWAGGLGAPAVIDEIEASGLQGRGGAGFPAHVKWRAVREARSLPKYVVLNADEGEPGTFKDREILLRRPDRVLEGLAIAAQTVGAGEVHLYLRGEFETPRRILQEALARFAPVLPRDLVFSFHAGDGAYVCGEETALLESIEGKRGMPRIKPPFPVEHGLWGQPTLVHNVETIACVPEIVKRGGPWFRGLGRSEPGTKLYCISGEVHRPGTYELPLGTTLDELLLAAGGMEGELRAFSPGGASSGFLPASYRSVPLDFGSLAKVGSMLGSAGVIVLSRDADLREALLDQLRFFEEESCGQCAPCRIGTRYLHEAVVGAEAETGAGPRLSRAAEVAWEMNEGSICGLGAAASKPLTSALEHFPEIFAASPGHGGAEE